MSFYKYILTRPNEHPFVGLENFVNVITSYYFKESIQVTGIYTVASVVGVIVYGLGVALLMNTKIRLSTPLKIVILLPWALPAVVSGLLWKWILKCRLRHPQRFALCGWINRQLYPIPCRSLPWLKPV